MGHNVRVNIPRPRFRLPVLGDILSIDAAKPTQRELRMAEELGPIFERKILSHRLVVVSGADLVAELNDESRFAKFLALPHRKLRALGGDGLFTAFNSEPNWGAAHRVLMPGFSRDAMQRYHQVMVDVADELVQHWRDRDGRLVDVTADLNKLTLENMARAGFGYSFDSFARDDDAFVAAIVRILGHVNRTSNDLPLMRLFDKKSRAQNERDIAYVHGVVDDVIEKRLLDNDTRHDDLLDLMLHTPDPETGELLDKVNIRHQVLTFLVAGNETTAGTVAFALYFLATHPSVAARVQEEADAAANMSAYEDVPKLRYIRSVVDETLRLWPSAPGYFRKARQDTSLASGRYPMKAGEWAFVLTLGLHRDPVWGADAHEFDPDRFSSTRSKSRPAQAYKPFGTGMRGCIGRQFALHESVLTLATLARSFDFELEDGYRLDIQESLTLKPQNMRMTVRAR
ncbi:cytochrome P450 [Rhodococcoides kyotonense]|uniref:Unspecific monooxygenase n=1 Tax=Rhodococcoides kyotonense TaxID=398843 RepID=A0A239I9C6_9NOCA|nr:cytochrome P450 [Rhodococcus kyotonensis]SNS88954.1 unspecific monooxygenase [Rhodococcus kyotonensis]